ncbi:10277_t:CDS:1 [Acaulospora colombiana]|uniref:10277_t:CDS:1 n=1 Tax=Acaulospora colombiana TaxID=27376 RepID=A0ACA9JXC3_9GLOM|nr:10277_t:CDS:1 [Acaulospora colombiana]
MASTENEIYEESNGQLGNEKENDEVLQKSERAYGLRSLRVTVKNNKILVKETQKFLFLNFIVSITMIITWVFLLFIHNYHPKLIENYLKYVKSAISISAILTSVYSNIKFFFSECEYTESFPFPNNDEIVDVSLRLVKYEELSRVENTIKRRNEELKTTRKRYLILSISYILIMIAIFLYNVYSTSYPDGRSVIESIDFLIGFLIFTSVMLYFIQIFYPEWLQNPFSFIIISILEFIMHPLYYILWIFNYTKKDANSDTVKSFDDQIKVRCCCFSRYFTRVVFNDSEEENLERLFNGLGLKEKSGSVA